MPAIGTGQAVSEIVPIVGEPHARGEGREAATHAAVVEHGGCMQMRLGIREKFFLCV